MKKKNEQSRQGEVAQLKTHEKLTLYEMEDEFKRQFGKEVVLVAYERE